MSFGEYHSYMDLRRLHHFVTLLDAGSYVAAAARLNLTQSALSHSIRSLEEQAAVPLLERDRAGIRTTRAGALLEEEARQMLRRMADLRHNIKVVAGREAATVRFGMAPLPAKLWMTDLLRGVMDDDGIVASASVANGAELTGLLKREYIDFFLCSRGALTDHPDLLLEPAGWMPLQWIVRAGHPLLAHAQQSPGALSAYPMVCMGPSFLRGDPNEPAPLFRGGRAAVQSDDFGVLLDLTLTSDAVLLGASLLLDRYPDALAPLHVRGDAPDMGYDLVAVQRRGRKLTPASRAMLDRLLKLMSDEPARNDWS